MQSKQIIRKGVHLCWYWVEEIGVGVRVVPGRGTGWEMSLAGMDSWPVVLQSQYCQPSTMATLILVPFGRVHNNACEQ